VDRREALKTLGAAAIGSQVALKGSASPSPRFSVGRIKQSASRWCYGKIALPDLCRSAKQIGLAAIDLLQPEDWPVVRDNGLVCSMGYPTKRNDFIATGFNDRANHAMLLRELEQTIPIAGKQGIPNVIAMFGNRKGKSDAEGLDTCVEGLNKIKALAEEQKVTICVELLNSKVDHADYQGDHTAWGAQVIEAVGSPRVKLLYDIYHMQIMEGDVIRTIRQHIGHIGHFHTGGVPGRHELDDTQELNWGAVARAIADAGFTGYMAHEFVPTRDPLTSLAEAFKTCDV